MIQQQNNPGSDNEQPLVLLENVHKIYDMGGAQVHALAGVSFSFKQGSFWAVTGPSGSGKSTLLNILGCLDRPTGGRYVFDGQDVQTLSDNALSEIRLRKMGFIFQSFNLIPQLTVAKNIEMPLYYLGWEAHEGAARARELAETVGLGERLDHRPTQLSGGQQQRVAIARALANSPNVLLVDEPTGNLDSTTGQQIMKLLVKLNAQGRTIVMVTHEPDIATHATHRLHMVDGRIDQIEDNG
jgi:putative ABC transport system ATP-binding protein